MTQLNVCMQTPVLKLGGTEISTLRLSKALINHGAKVKWISTNGPLKEEILKEGIPLIQADIKGRGPVGFSKGVWSLQRIFKDNAFDIVHCHEVYPAIMSSWAKNFSKTKASVIWHLRGIHEYSYPVMAYLAKTNFDFIIANSHQQRNKLLLYNCPPEKVKVIYNSVEEKSSDKSPAEIKIQLGIRPDVKIIGSIGRVVPQKGNKYLIDAFSELLKLGHQVHLVIVGDGEERPTLEKHVSSLGITDKVSFLGFRRDIPNLLSVFDVFAFPTLNEAFGNVAVEAMYAGVPVVASYVGGLPEIITNYETGFLVPPADKDKWVETFTFVLDNPELCERIKDKALKAAKENFSLDKMMLRIENLYSTLITKHKAG